MACSRALPTDISAPAETSSPPPAHIDTTPVPAPLDLSTPLDTGIPSTSPLDLSNPLDTSTPSLDSGSLDISAPPLATGGFDTGGLSGGDFSGADG